MVLKANDRRTSSDEFRGPRSDYVRQVALETTTCYNCAKGEFLPPITTTLMTMIQGESSKLIIRDEYLHICMKL
ncbi:hypothetical protein TNCV_4046751 [Trichonephila clavipes]|nr:hypothetical protein TNCV_4046751 [Trichonephila clavipes]